MWIHESHLQGMILVLQFSVYEYLYHVHLYAWMRMCAYVCTCAYRGCSWSPCVFRNSPPLCVVALTEPGTR